MLLHPWRISFLPKDENTVGFAHLFSFYIFGAVKANFQSRIYITKTLDICTFLVYDILEVVSSYGGTRATT